MNREILINVLALVWVWLQWFLETGLIIMACVAVLGHEYSQAACYLAWVIWFQMPDKVR